MSTLVKIKKTRKPFKESSSLKNLNKTLKKEVDLKEDLEDDIQVDSIIDSNDLVRIVTNFNETHIPIKACSKEKKLTINAELENVLLNKLNNIALCNVNTIDSNGNSLLILLLKKKLFNVANKLLEMKPDYDLTPVNSQGKTALIIACEMSVIQILNKILTNENKNKCEINAIDNNGNTALIIACNKSLFKSAFLATHTDINLLGHVNNNGETALMYACNKISSTAKNIITRSNGNTLTHINLSGKTPFILSCQKRHTTICLQMLNFHSKCNLSQVDNEGTTALLYACKNRMLNVVKKILDYPNDCAMEHIDTNNKTALSTSLNNYSYYDDDDEDYEDEEEEGYREMSTEIINKFLNYPSLCKIDHIINGYSVLDIVSEHYTNTFMTKVLELQIELGINLITENTLHIAISNKKFALIDYILGSDSYENLHLGNIKHDKTILMEMCYNNMENYALLILDTPELCNISYISSYGESALTRACKTKLEVVALKILDYLLLHTNNLEHIEHIEHIEHTNHLENNTRGAKSKKYKKKNNHLSQLYKKAFNNAQRNKMNNVVLKMLQFMPNEMNKRIDEYTNDPILMSLGNMSLNNTNFKLVSDKLHSINEYNKKYELALKQTIKKSECAICFEDNISNSNYYCLTKCGHTISLCSDCCTGALSNLCPLCRTYIGSSYVKAYVV